MESPLQVVSTNRDSTGFIIWEVANNKIINYQGALLKILVIFLSVHFKHECGFAALKAFAFGSCICVCSWGMCVYRD